MKLIPVYTTAGDLGAYLVYPYLYNPQGEWIGWVTANREVFSLTGDHIGSMTMDPRILRQREWNSRLPKRELPDAPVSIRPPAHMPLPPQMSEVPSNMIDVLDDAPELLPPVGFGDLEEELD
jgi:hypothetical protein